MSTPKKDALQRVYDLLADEKTLVAFANSNLKEGETPHVAGDMAISQKFAGLVAANGAAYLSVSTQYDTVTEARYLEALARFARGELGGRAGSNAYYIAHTTWLSGQPFRGSDRISRIANFAFTTLSPEEVAKDRDQIVRSAQFILDWLAATANVEAA